MSVLFMTSNQVNLKLSHRGKENVRLEIISQKIVLRKSASKGGENNAFVGMAYHHYHSNIGDSYSSGGRSQT